ncbi:MAG: ROK family protein [Blastocatellia bacterium]
MTSPQHTIDPASHQEVALTEDARVLAIDIGGSGLKAAILDINGDMLSERVRIETPKKLVPETLLRGLVELVEPLGAFDVVSVGFPGVVRKGVIVTAPNLGTKQFKGYNLQMALEKQLGKPTRVLNDADMQGLAAISGHGVEMVITLGTGFGSALFLDGELAPHLEIAHIPFRNGEDYDQQVGDKARKKVGKKQWNRRVQRAIKTLRILTNFDRLYIGGGNADKLSFKFEPDVQIISNEYGVRGGAWLWRKYVTSEKQ